MSVALGLYPMALVAYTVSFFAPTTGALFQRMGRAFGSGLLFFRSTGEDVIGTGWSVSS